MLQQTKLILIALSLTSPLAIPVIAAETDTSATRFTDETLVIVTKRPKQPEELGFSISVVSEDELNSIDAAESITQFLSGVQAVRSNGSQTTFQIRGIGAVDHQALTPTAAAVYVDGVYLATNVQASPLLFDIVQAEVIKGPQGSLYGRNASAGAIQFISAKPEQDSSVALNLGYGNFARQSLALTVNKPLTDDVSLRFASRSLRRDPVFENIVTDATVAAPENAAGLRDEIGTRLSILYQPNEQSELLLRTHYSEDNGINTAPLNSALSEQLGDHQLSIGPNGIQDTDNEFRGSAIHWKQMTDDYQLEWITAYEGFNQQYGFDFDGTPAPFGQQTLNANLAYDRNLSQYSSEVRLSSENEQLEWMVGVYLAKENFDQSYLIWCGELDQQSLLGTCPYVGAPGRTGSNPASATDAMSLLSEISQSRNTAALFTFNTLKLNDALSMILGGRLSYEEIQASGSGRHYYADGLSALNNRNDQGLAEGGNRISEHHFTANLGLNYQFNTSYLGYVSLANGFKSGGFNGEVINNANHFSDEGLFESETVTSLELGVKYTSADLSYNLSLFNMDYKRPQARIFVPFSTADGGQFISNSLSNLEQAKSYGAEMDVSWRATDDLTIRANITSLDTRIIQNIQPDVPQNAEIFNGNPLPFAADLSAVVSSDYNFELAANIRASLQFSAKYQDDFYLDAEGLEERKQEAYSLYQLRFNLYLTQGVDISLWGNNLTDSQYATSGFGFIGYNRFLGEPRTYGITVNKQF